MSVKVEDAPVEHKKIVRQKGPAVGKITGVNHIQMVVLDMDKTVHFYRDLLGFDVIRTLGDDFVPPLPKDENTPAGWKVPHNCFMQMPDGTVLTFLEVTGAKPPQHSLWSPSYWPGEHIMPTSPEKLDHMAFNVPTAEDLRWFQKHLRENGVETSEILTRHEPPRFVDSLYFKDPSGIPLEIASWAHENPAWEGHEVSDWFEDKNPPSSLLS